MMGYFFASLQSQVVGRPQALRLQEILALIHLWFKLATITDEIELRLRSGTNLVMNACSRSQARPTKDT